jgi:hypothetical protein
MAFLPCCRNGALKEGGKWWCASHAPSRVVQRRAITEARWEEKRKKEDRRYAIDDQRRRVVAAAKRWYSADETEQDASLRRAIKKLLSLEAKR